MVHLKHMLLGLVLALMGTGATAQQEYQIRPGDTLAVEILEDTSLNRSVTVLPDGRFSFPLAGTISAAGRTVSQVEQAIASSIGSNFNTPPNVFVSVQPGLGGATQVGPDAIGIYFLGQVNAPGRVDVEPGTTFLQALALSGGPTPFAATKRIQLRRTDPRTHEQKVYVIDYRALGRGAALKSDVPLQDGDVVLVPERRLFE